MLSDPLADSIRSNDLPLPVPRSTRASPPAPEIPIMFAKFLKLTLGARREADQRRRVSLQPGPMPYLASSRARLSLRSRRTTSPGTMRRAARSASLSASAPSHPSGATGGVGVSSMGEIYSARE